MTETAAPVDQAVERLARTLHDPFVDYHDRYLGVTHRASRRFLESRMQANSNYEEAPDTVWNFVGNEDYRLAPGAKGAIDQGSTLYLGIVSVDIDNEERDNSPDIGADEAP